MNNTKSKIQKTIHNVLLELIVQYEQLFIIFNQILVQIVSKIMFKIFQIIILAYLEFYVHKKALIIAWKIIHVYIVIMVKFKVLQTIVFV